MRHNFTLLFFAAFLATLAACNTAALGPQTSGIDSPSAWARLPAATQEAPLVSDAGAEVEANWWKHFNDPTLDHLIELAIKSNKTLAIAKARIEEAQAGRTAARSALLPQINATADASRGNQGFFTNGQALTTKDIGLQATWELDLFGKNQARLGAAKAILQSSEATRQAVLVALLAEVARNYFDLRDYERQIAITEENLKDQEKTLELTRVQLTGALASDFDVQRAAAQVSTTAAQLPVLQIAYDTTLNHLNVLLGEVPGKQDALLKTFEPLKPLDQRIIVVAPATALAARPDIRAAERQFAASISAHKAATLELLPTISLLGLFGAQNTSLFSTSPTWSAGVGLVMPILNFGRIQADIDTANAREHQAFLTYQQTVLEALENVENALTNYLHETGRNASLKNAATQNRKAVELARQQYTSGYNSLLDVLVVERNALDAESALASSDTKLRKDLVNIYTAVGGGWDGDR